MTGYRIIFMGTPEFACPALQMLINRHEQIIAVVTQPDRPRGRGQRLMPPPVKELAESGNIPVLQPQKVREPQFVEALLGMKPDLIIVVAFGQILPKALLDIPPKGCINVHASLLPRYRGAAPLNWCLINGEPETGVTTMLMDPGLDTGSMLLKRAAAIHENEDISSLHDRMSIMGAELLAETLDRLKESELIPEPQDNSQTCYAPMLTKENGIINWHRDARSIHNQVRGMMVWPGAYTFMLGQQLKILKTTVGEGTGLPGKILCAEKGVLEVACLTGSLYVHELQLAGKKRLDTACFLAGSSLVAGMQLGVTEGTEAP